MSQKYESNEKNMLLFGQLKKLLPLAFKGVTLVNPVEGWGETIIDIANDPKLEELGITFLNRSYIKKNKHSVVLSSGSGSVFCDDNKALAEFGDELLKLIDENWDANKAKYETDEFKTLTKLAIINFTRLNDLKKADHWDIWLRTIEFVKKHDLRIGMVALDYVSFVTCAEYPSICYPIDLKSQTTKDVFRPPIYMYSNDRPREETMKTCQAFMELKEVNDIDFEIRRGIYEQKINDIIHNDPIWVASGNKSRYEELFQAASKLLEEDASAMKQATKDAIDAAKDFLESNNKVLSTDTKAIQEKLAHETFVNSYFKTVMGSALTLMLPNEPPIEYPLLDELYGRFINIKTMKEL